MFDLTNFRAPIHRRTLCSVLMLAAVLGLSGCGDYGTSPDGGKALPAWLAEMPERTVQVAPGEVVWAVVPEAGTESAAVGTYRLEAASGATAVLVDSLGNRFADVPAALIHPASRFPDVELAANSVVLASRWDAGKVVGRVASSGDDEVRVTYDWNGATETGAMDAVLPLPKGGDNLVLHWVAYRTDASAAWYKGLCFAQSEDRLWISEDSGNVAIVARDAVRPLDDLGQAEYAAGDEVSAYSWGYGYRAGKVAEVLEPGLRYAVELEAGETRPFFFENLTQDIPMG